LIIVFRDEIRSKILLGRKLVGYFIIGEFLLCGLITYVLFYKFDSATGEKYRFVVLPMILLWIVVWLILIALTSRIIYKKLGLICPHCGCLCYSRRNSEIDTEKKYMITTGKCDHCQCIVFRFQEDQGRQTVKDVSESWFIV